MHRAEFLQTRVKQAQGAMIAAHPYRRRFLEEPAERPSARNDMLTRASQDGFFQMCQGIEALNGRGLTIQNEFSLELGGILSANMTAGSDAHKVEQIGTVATQFQRPVYSLKDLIRELRSGRYKPIDLRKKED
mgnify:FL=1